MASSRMSPAFSFPAGLATAVWKEKSKPRVSPARTRLPYLGLCLGMQVATIEFARNVCGIDNANSTEFDQNSLGSGHLLARRTTRRPKQRRQHAARDLADQNSTGTLAEKIYGKDEVLGAPSSSLRVQHEISRPDARERLRDFRNIARWLARRVGRVARSSLFPGLPISPRISKQTKQTAPALQRVYPGCIGASGLV